MASLTCFDRGFPTFDTAIFLRRSGSWSRAIGGGGHVPTRSIGSLPTGRQRHVTLLCSDEAAAGACRPNLPTSDRVQTMRKSPNEDAKSNAAGRTPGEDFRARLVCFHEAGHVVVGHSLGWRVRRVTVGTTRFEPVP